MAPRNGMLVHRRSLRGLNQKYIGSTSGRLDQFTHVIATWLACVPCVIGEGEGEQKRREKMRGDWGEGRGNNF